MENSPRPSMRTMRDSTRKGAQWVTTALLDDREWNDEGIGVSEADNEPSNNVQLRWLKTENEKEQGNGSGNFFTSTWSSATGCGQLREP